MSNNGLKLTKLIKLHWELTVNKNSINKEILMCDKIL